jgi:hypothetical protein
MSYTISIYVYTYIEVTSYDVFLEIKWSLEAQFLHSFTIQEDVEIRHGFTQSLNENSENGHIRLHPNRCIQFVTIHRFIRRYISSEFWSVSLTTQESIAKSYE